MEGDERGSSLVRRRWYVRATGDEFVRERRKTPETDRDRAKGDTVECLCVDVDGRRSVRKSNRTHPGVCVHNEPVRLGACDAEI